MDVNLILLKKGIAAKEIPLPGAVTVIGRRSECDLCIPLKAVSRKHCQLNTDGGKLKIRDLNSSNGTMVNGRSVEEAMIQPGDSLKIGPLTFLVKIDGRPVDFGPSDITIEKPTPAQTDENTAQFDDLDDLGDFEISDDELDSLLDQAEG
ncbi:FHA domain-containing protein [Planctomycetota bacterium]